MKDTLAINTIKISGTSAVNLANSGHPGIVLGAAPITHTLFTRHLKYDPLNPLWVNRDRFILSAGHGSALLYAQLRLLGLVSTKELKNFRQKGSLTPGHPEVNLTPGVEATTGPLGQGIAIAVGLAVAEESLRSRFTELEHFTYALCGDGDLQEGVAMESLSFAGRQNLSKLIILHDSNDVQLDTKVADVFNENLKQRMEAIKFDYQLVTNPTVELIDKAISNAKTSNKPSFIEIKTVIGQDTPQAGTSSVHGSPLGENINVLCKNLNWSDDDFFIPQAVEKLYKETIFYKGAKEFAKWSASKELDQFLNQKAPQINLNIEQNLATRSSSGKVIEFLNNNYLNWIGGSADLSSSTKAKGGDETFSPENRLGRNILFGVREFAMAGIANGLALHSNLQPFVSTFYVFSDYLKPALRLGALMNLPVVYIMTHDSVFVGEDGPTHQPIEQNAMIRSIPNTRLIRPADEKEVIGAFTKALTNKGGPTVIALTRQSIESLAKTSSAKIQSGPYFLRQSNSPWTLVASGSELANASKIAEEMDLNLVSISNSKGDITWNVQKAITIEAAVTYGMQKFGLYNIGIDDFGLSAPGAEVYQARGMDLNTLLKKVKQIING